MQIIFKPEFEHAFNSIWDYISQDSLERADAFKIALKRTIEKLPDMPYRCRQSYYYDDENVRDLVFKGYTVP